VKRTRLFLAPAVVLAAAVGCGFLGHQTPSGQAALAAMDVAALRADFNGAADGTRLIVLLSPT
jgi:hypothetical protein